jgi:hypothetical protein
MEEASALEGGIPDCEVSLRKQSSAALKSKVGSRDETPGSKLESMKIGNREEMMTRREEWVVR